MESNFSMGVLEKTIAGVISGSILLLIGFFIYKRVRKKQTIDEALIEKELKIQFIVNEFRRIRAKYNKPLTEKSMSTQIEQEITNLWGTTDNLLRLCQQFNISVDEDLHLLRNHLYAQKGVLWCNNPTLISDEKIPVFMNVNKMEAEGVKMNRNTGREVYFELYSNFESEVNELIAKNRFFKKYWNKK